MQRKYKAICASWAKTDCEYNKKLSFQRIADIIFMEIDEL